MSEGEANAPAAHRAGRTERSQSEQSDTVSEGEANAPAARVDHEVSSGTFSLDGETFEVENNIWVVGDDDECMVIDAPHAIDAILAVVGDRTVTAIVCTHAHDDHVRSAPALRQRTGAPILLHPDDRPLWELTHGGPGDPGSQRWDADLSDGQTLSVAGTTLRVLHTPGHAPGAVSLRRCPRNRSPARPAARRGIVLPQRRT